MLTGSVAQGDAAAVRELAEHFQHQGQFVPQGADALDIAAVLARYLRDLPEPLLTFGCAPTQRRTSGES